MVRNIVPTCCVCGSVVTDHVEPEVQKEGEIKEGKYIENNWICNECFNDRNNN
ncbi:MAG TPA: hypothetical protein VFT71_01520 [Candidatus Nitrosocosmicus sp.]|nr:hypothetical protein [Candidatus Nitrosocosmicus sp.]